MELKQLEIFMKDLTRALLIVPYGIETRENKNDLYDCRSFNRTLWN